MPKDKAQNVFAFFDDSSDDEEAEKRDQEQVQKKTAKNKMKSQQKKDVEDMRGLAGLGTKPKKKKKKKKNKQGESAQSSTSTEAAAAATSTTTAEPAEPGQMAQTEEWQRLDQLKMDQKFAEDMRAALTESSTDGPINAKQRRKEERAKKNAAMSLDQFLHGASNATTPDAGTTQNKNDVDRAVQLALAQEKLRESAGVSSLSGARTEVPKEDRAAVAEVDRLTAENRDLKAEVERYTQMLTDMTQMLQAADKAEVINVLAENAKLQETISEYAAEVARLHSENQRLKSMSGGSGGSASSSMLFSPKQVYGRAELLKYTAPAARSAIASDELPPFETVVITGGEADAGAGKGGRSTTTPRGKGAGGAEGGKKKWVRQAGTPKGGAGADREKWARGGTVQ